MWWVQSVIERFWPGSAEKSSAHGADPQEPVQCPVGSICDRTHLARRKIIGDILAPKLAFHGCQFSHEWMIRT